MSTKNEQRQLLIIEANGVRKTEGYFGREPPLEQLQRIVGGYLEMIPHSFKIDGKPAHMYVDEDGLSKHLPYNQEATALCGGFHSIVGTAVLVPYLAPRTIQSGKTSP